MRTFSQLGATVDSSASPHAVNAEPQMASKSNHRTPTNPASLTDIDITRVRENYTRSAKLIARVNVKVEPELALSLRNRKLARLVLFPPGNYLENKA